MWCPQPCRPAGALAIAPAGAAISSLGCQPGRCWHLTTGAAADYHDSFLATSVGSRLFSQHPEQCPSSRPLWSMEGEGFHKRGEPKIMRKVSLFCHSQIMLLRNLYHLSGTVLLSCRILTLTLNHYQIQKGSEEVGAIQATWLPIHTPDLSA